MIVIQVLPVSQATMNIRPGHQTTDYSLVFMATVPPLGYNTYFVRPAGEWELFKFIYVW